MVHSTHYFFALTLPDEMKRRLAEARRVLEKEFPFKKWLHPDDYHITLAFLGDAPDAARKAALNGVIDSLNGKEAFTLELTGTGVFGRKDCPRILWAGVKEDKRLHAVRDLVYQACLDAGFHLDKRPFTPHITLARKFEGNLFELEKLQQKADIIGEHTIYPADKVSLYQTHLGASPSYEAVFTIGLTPDSPL